MAVPRTHLVLSLLVASLLSTGCGLQLMPQSANAHEARLDKDGIKIAVRVTKKGFCLGYLAVFHGEEGGKGEKPKEIERCTTARSDRPAGAPEGEHDFDSLTQFLAEARKKSAKVHVVVRSEAGVTPAAVRRVMEAMRAKKDSKDAKDGFNDFVLSESADGL